MVPSAQPPAPEVSATDTNATLEPTLEEIARRAQHDALELRHAEAVLRTIVDLLTPYAAGRDPRARVINEVIAIASVRLEMSTEARRTDG